MASVSDIHAALSQQLESDRLLGLRCVPMSLPAPIRSGRPTTGRSARHRAVPAQPGAPSAARGASPADPTAQSEPLRVLDQSQVRSCTKCELSRSRTQTVFGQGNANARLVFVGEAPGFEEDRQGLAFIGKAGQLLTKMIIAMGLTRDEVFICNVLKCRPPNNRTPSAEEILACSPYLQRQIEIIDPEVVVALGAPAAKTLLNTSDAIGRLRGRFHEYYVSGRTGDGKSVPLMPTYHPAYLLRSPEEKGKTWSDLQLVMERLGLSAPARKSST